MVFSRIDLVLRVYDRFAIGRRLRQLLQVPGTTWVAVVADLSEGV